MGDEIIFMYGMIIGRRFLDNDGKVLAVFMDLDWKHASVVWKQTHTYATEQHLYKGAFDTWK